MVAPCPRCDVEAPPEPLWIHVAEPGAFVEGREAELLELLEDRERERHGRIRPVEVRQQFLAAHALLRQSLSSQVDVPPQTWRFGEGPHGKPHLTAPSQVPCPWFSLSHTRGLVLCALSWAGPVGVDAERFDRRARVDDLIPRVCSADEQGSLAGLQDGDLRGAFFRRWVLKEALLKALGTGLTIPAATVSFALEPARLLALPPEASDRPWQVGLLELTEDHAAAWAVESRRPTALQVGWADQSRPRRTASTSPL